MAMYTAPILTNPYTVSHLCSITLSRQTLALFVANNTQVTAIKSTAFYKVFDASYSFSITFEVSPFS